jgi:hypothetical protein
MGAVARACIATVEPNLLRGRRVVKTGDVYAPRASAAFWPSLH